VGNGLDVLSAEQVGIRDSDGDGILDPIDTIPVVTVDPWPPEVTHDNTPTYVGVAEDVAYDSPTRTDVTINSILAVEYQVDHNGQWRAATPIDGVFDETSEGFKFTTSPLTDGGHSIVIRAINRSGNISAPLDAYYDGGENKLKLGGWRFGAYTPGVGGAVVNGGLVIDVTAGPARACWYQDLDGATLRNRTVRFEAEMRKTALMDQPAPPFTNPYISLQVRKGDGSWIYNFGGILNSRSLPGGPWIGETRDILLPQDMITLRAMFCVWNATPGIGQARNLLLRLVVPPPPPANLLASAWTWIPATAGAAGTRSAGIYSIDVASAGARGCWIQDLPGATLQGHKVHYEGALRRSVAMNSAEGFVNPYISLQVRQSNGQWQYNYGGILNATAPPGSFGVVAKDIILPTDMLTLRAAYCVWEATPGVASGKDFKLSQVAAAQEESLMAETWDAARPDTPSSLPEDAIAQPDEIIRLWLPMMQGR